MGSSTLVKSFAEVNFLNLLFMQSGMESGNETALAKSTKGTYVALVSIPRMSSVK